MHLKVLTIVLWFILKQNDINNDQFNRILTIFHYKKKEIICITSLDQTQFRLIPHLWTTIPPSQLQYKFIRVSLDSWIFF